VINKNQVTQELITTLNNSTYNFMCTQSLGYLSATLGSKTLLYDTHAQPAHWVLERFPNMKLLFRNNMKDIEPNVLYKKLAELAHPGPMRIEINV